MSAPYWLPYPSAEASGEFIPWGERVRPNYRPLNRIDDVGGLAVDCTRKSGGGIHSLSGSSQRLLNLFQLPSSFPG